MGMDLIPRRKTLNSYHLNWSGWRFVLQLLEDLDANLSEASGSNDGDYVKAETARNWAQLIENALAADKIKLVFVPDEAYVGGGHYSTTCDEGEPLTEDYSLFLKEFCDFLRKSQGFRQY
jgi:hypothetical protein